MRANRGRLGWAVGISLLCHGLLGAVFFLAFPDARSPSRSGNAPADVKVTSSLEYETLTLSLEDPLPRVRPQVVVKAPAVLPKDITATPNASSGNTAVQPAVGSIGAANDPPAVNPKVGAGAGVAPLHGPMTRPGLSVVYVLDRSGSMGQGRKLAHAVALLKSSLRQLGPDVRFQIVTYDSQATIARLNGTIELVLASAPTIAQADSLLDDLTGEGSSRHAEGFRAGLSLQPDLLILLSDAGDLTPNEVKRIKQTNHKGTAIHAVMLGTSGEKNLAALRELTGAGRLHIMPLPIQPLLMP